MSTPLPYRTANVAIRAKVVLDASRSGADPGRISDEYRVDPALIQRWLRRLESDTKRWERRREF